VRIGGLDKRRAAFHPALHKGDNPGGEKHRNGLEEGMTVAIDATAWTGLLLGLTALFAGIGALRKPGAWRTMLDEVERSPALQFVCGMLELLIGALVYLANPWLPADIMTCVLKALGGAMMFEALAILGFVDIYSQFWLRSLTHMHRGWALTTTLFGLILTALSLARFN
jgi:uncharacterized protein YjeT (DUF2065 family)